jgi:hypothetical protein
MADESFRVRRQVLRYYLVDGTLELIEPTVRRSPRRSSSCLRALPR